MDINYDMLTNKVARTVNNIESKPHVRYIRYLLTKRFSPIVIKKELQKLGLSAPHEEPLTVYYLSAIDPMIKKHKLGHIYSDYKNKLLKTSNKTNSFSKNKLKFRLEFSENLEDQKNFCKFIKDLDIESCWSAEIMRMYGDGSNVPRDDNGEKIIKTSYSRINTEKVLTNEKRYLIEKMILEGVPSGRIANYFREKYGHPIYEHDIASYQRVFFNMRTFSIEEKIKLLEEEKSSLESYFGKIKEDDSLSVADKAVVRRQTKERIAEIADNIKTLNAFFSESAIRQLEQENEDFERLFLDVVQRGYNRFVDLDKYKDRDVVEPLVKVAKMMGYAHEKALTITDKKKENDKHSSAEIMSLYDQRVEEFYKEQKDQFEKINEESEKLLSKMKDNKQTDLEEESGILGLDEINQHLDDEDEE